MPKNLYKSDKKKNKAIGKILTKYGEDRSAVQANVQWLIKQARVLLMVLRSDVGLMTGERSHGYTHHESPRLSSHFTD